MKASDLIKQVNKLVAEHGDLSILLDECNLAHEVRLVETEMDGKIINID